MRKENVSFLIDIRLQGLEKLREVKLDLFEVEILNEDELSGVHVRVDYLFYELLVLVKVLCKLF